MLLVLHCVNPGETPDPVFRNVMINGVKDLEDFEIPSGSKSYLIDQVRTIVTNYCKSTETEQVVEWYLHSNQQILRSDYKRP